MSRPIKMPKGTGPITIERADLAELLSEINEAREATDGDGVLRQLGNLVPALEELIPNLSYHEAGVINGYLRQVSDRLSERERKTQPPSPLPRGGDE